MGRIEEFQGDSSEIAVSEAVKFLEGHRAGDKPMFAVIWYGTPHSPFKALPDDKSPFSQLDGNSANHYGELVAMDRSIGTLRQALRRLGIAENTLLVFCSDNGGLPGITPETVGGLRGNKGSVYEGGLRVPGIIEWPAVIEPRVTNYPGLHDGSLSHGRRHPRTARRRVCPTAGRDQPPAAVPRRDARARQPIPFRFGAKAALVDNRYKLLTNDLAKGEFQLYDLEADPQETNDIRGQKPEVFERMKRELLAWNETVEASFAGRDYPGRRRGAG